MVTNPKCLNVDAYLHVALGAALFSQLSQLLNSMRRTAMTEETLSHDWGLKSGSFIVLPHAPVGSRRPIGSSTTLQAAVVAEQRPVAVAAALEG